VDPLSEDRCPDCGFLFPAPGLFWYRCPHPPLGTFNVQRDEIPGGQVIENLSPTPQRFYSKSAIKRAAEAKGLVQVVRHAPERGTDKSKHTQRWI
jgi:hypothetical protein